MYINRFSDDHNSVAEIQAKISLSHLNNNNNSIIKTDLLLIIMTNLLEAGLAPNIIVIVLLDSTCVVNSSIKFASIHKYWRSFLSI